MITSLKPFSGSKSVLRIQAEAITYRGGNAPASPRLLQLDIYSDQENEYPLVTEVSKAIRESRKYYVRGHQFFSVSEYLDNEQRSIDFFKTLKIR